MDNQNEFFDIYLEDMKEHLELLNESLLKLEKNYENKEIINKIFRAFHTMKGSTATMAYFHTSEILHSMEDLLQEMRDGRISASQQMIDLLFECHDFIEGFVEKISITQSEDGIDCPEIIQKLHEYIHMETPPEIKQETQRQEDIKLKEDISIYVSSSDIDYIKRKVSLGFSPYIIHARISEDCQFKAIRAWMFFNELKQYAEILKAIPNPPADEDFIDSTFKLEEKEISALIISDKTSQILSSTLEAALMEIEGITVDDFIYEDKDDSNLVVCILQDEGPEYTIDNAVIPDSYLAEITNHVQRAEQYCLEIGFNPKDTASLTKIRDAFQIIKKLASFINHSLVFCIAAETGLLLEDIFMTKTDISEEQLDLLVKSLDFIKGLSSDTSLQGDKKHLSQINKHVDMLFHGVTRKVQDYLQDSALPIDGLKLGETLVKNGVVDSKNVNDFISSRKEGVSGLELGQALVKEEKARLKDVVDAIGMQSAAKTEQKGQSLIRIPEQKVDSLVDMLGELLIIQSLHRQEMGEMLSTINRTDNKLVNNIIRMERITREIQTISMSLRMVSLKQSFQKLLRIGRDTAVELDKDINFSMTGEDTEIDRSVVEKIQDPLMHLVRNAVSHGVESAAERLNSGKPAQGQVGINAYNKRGFVYIEIIDDGKGLSPDKLYRKAKEKNLIDPNKTYTEDEIIRFIYLPGFSTQDHINSVSGRGVGMNVVETEILKIGGKIEISNRPGKGCVFVLKIPVHLATINGTVIDAFGERYILPTLNIKQMLKPEVSHWIRIKGKQEMIKIREEIIPVIPIEKVLDIPQDKIHYEDGMVVVMELDHKLKALPVSAVLGKQEVVVKPLGPDFRNLDFASGATILGDGKVSLILDVEALFKAQS